ncbi:MAG: hypothetical protein HKP61_05245, partial [Dactylosporangium sp.]|nr:hypothetical protein [Dactylosporangium sp.]NNJ60353.1 hypothetical protein [Dactylosporangium sp.]
MMTISQLTGQPVPAGTATGPRWGETPECGFVSLLAALCSLDPATAERAALPQGRPGITEPGPDALLGTDLPPGVPPEADRTALPGPPLAGVLAEAPDDPDPGDAVAAGAAELPL